MNIIKKINGIECSENCIKISVLVFILIFMFTTIISISSRIMSNSNYGNISNKVFYHIDNSKHDDFYKIYLVKDSFKPIKNIYISTDFGFNSYWIKIPYSVVKESFKSNLSVLSLNHNHLNDLHAHYINSEGDVVNISFNENSALFPYIELSKNMDIQSDIYIHIENYYSAFKIHLTSYDGFTKAISYLNIFVLFIIGIIFTTLLIDLVLSLIFRDKGFLLYSFYQNSVFYYVFFISGVAKMYFNLGQDWFLGVVFYICLSTLVFIYNYLDIKNKIPKLKPLYTYLSIISAICIFLSLVSYYLPELKRVLNISDIILVIVCTLLVSYTILYLFIKKLKISMFFIAGTLLQILVVFSTLLGTYVSNDANIFYKFLFIYVAAVNGVLFTVGILYQLKELKDKNIIFYNLATTDKLTGAYNRYYFEKKINEIIEDLKRDSTNLKLGILDIDHFKLINDTYGHDIGDQVLKELVKIVNKSIRDSDTLFRWGGEEFALLFNGISIQRVIEVGERIRKNIESSTFNDIGRITVSIGISSYRYKENIDDWFKRADKALYKAKNSGRNRIMIEE